MEGNPADLTVYRDSDITHDHTYIGNGCSGGDGSITPCETRIVKTADDEDQKNGTYYNFQAGTSGAGAAVTTDNTNSPDTFCPLGWQLPYGGTGGDYYNQSKSWKYLLDSYEISYDDGTKLDVNAIRSYPLSFIFAGDYRWGTGRLYYLKYTGYYWSSIVNNTGVYFMALWDPVIHPSYIAGKLYGLSVRCALGISDLEKLSMASAFTH